MSEINLSPSTQTKLKTIEAANKMRHGSPKLHEILRQRCRERMREKRGQLFNGRRLTLQSTPDEVQETLTTIVRKEFNDIMFTDWQRNTEAFNIIFDTPLEFEEAFELQSEIVAEEEQWIVEEYYNELQRQSQEEEDHLSQEIVFCPVCQITGLQEIPGFICCNSCQVQFPTQISLADFKNRIIESASIHSLKCTQRPYFNIVPLNDNIDLFLTCESCSAFSPVFD